MKNDHKSNSYILVSSRVEWVVWADWVTWEEWVEELRKILCSHHIEHYATHVVRTCVVFEVLSPIVCMCAHLPNPLHILIQ